VAGLGLELGARAAHRGGDHRVGGVPADHGGSLDLGVFLDRVREAVSYRWNRWLESSGCIQFLASLAAEGVVGSQDQGVGEEEYR